MRACVTCRHPLRLASLAPQDDGNQIFALFVISLRVDVAVIARDTHRCHHRPCAGDPDFQIQFSNSHFEIPRAHAHSSRASREVSFSLCPSPRARGLPRSRPQYEGHGAPRGAPLYRFASGIACEAMVFRKRIALRRSIAGLWARGPYFRVRTGEVTRPLIRTAFAAFVRSASSRRTAEPHSWPGR